MRLQLVLIAFTLLLVNGARRVTTEDFSEAISTLVEELTEMKSSIIEGQANRQDARVPRGREGKAGQMEELEAIEEAKLMKQRVEEASRR